uniref:uncharacterized protein LOC118552680 n=1 Tax=Halichoerus grypus TaxID=9711 RepID=UPI0016590D3F|nr:uncharacterized protein LOC118552680 [Halichoerus grypus]
MEVQIHLAYAFNIMTSGKALEEYALVFGTQPCHALTSSFPGGLDSVDSHSLGPSFKLDVCRPGEFCNCSSDPIAVAWSLAALPYPLHLPLTEIKSESLVLWLEPRSPSVTPVGERHLDVHTQDATVTLASDQRLYLGPSQDLEPLLHLRDLEARHTASLTSSPGSHLSHSFAPPGLLLDTLVSTRPLASLFSFESITPLMISLPSPLASTFRAARKPASSSFCHTHSEKFKLCIHPTSAFSPSALGQLNTTTQTGLKATLWSSLTGPS